MTAPAWLTALGIPPECVSVEGSAHEGGKEFSVQRRHGERIWRVKVDGCWLAGGNQKRIDYLFCVQAKSGELCIVLVELKGQDYGVALKQIEDTLDWICKRSHGQNLHDRVLPGGPMHAAPNEGGVRAFVVLGTGKKVRQHMSHRELIRTKYHVIVRSHEKRLSFGSVEELTT